MRGKISHWRDDKGFGFILPEDGTEKLFFHISSVKTRGRRPRIGDSVLYESARDSQNRLQAKAVVIEGVIDQSASGARSMVSQTAPPKKNATENPMQTQTPASKRGGGCLGISLLLAAVPIAVGVSLYFWFA
jgi:cold shock CspA family protein